MEHDDFGVCPFVTAQRLLQGKWAIILLHQLYDGTKRFGELERATGITHATLASQLKALEKDGMPRSRPEWSTLSRIWAAVLAPCLAVSRPGEMNTSPI